MNPNTTDPFVIWFTGLSGSGKSTLSTKLFETLKESQLPLEHLDGDSMRSLLPGVGFTRSERNSHIQHVGLLASYLQKHGVSVIASFISPYEESRQFVRRSCRNFFEVHLSTPLEECEKRDPKGLYARARRGEIKNFTGIDDPYEIPKRPELCLDTSRLSADEAVLEIKAMLRGALREFA